MECNFQLVSEVPPKIPLEERAIDQIIWTRRNLMSFDCRNWPILVHFEISLRFLLKLYWRKYEITEFFFFQEKDLRDRMPNFL